MAELALVALHPYDFPIKPVSVGDRIDVLCTLPGFSMRLVAQPPASGAKGATTPDRELLAVLHALGCGDDEGDDTTDGQRPTAAQAAALTADAAALLCDRLSNGRLEQRFDAVRALRAHQALPPAQRAPASHSAATLEALAVAARRNVMTEGATTDARTSCVHQALTTALVVLPASATVDECEVTAAVLLRLLAMQTLSLAVEGLVECDALAATAAARIALSQRVDVAALSFADVASYAPGAGLARAPAEALIERCQAVAFNTLTVLLTALHAQPHDAAAHEAAAALAAASSRVAMAVLRHGDEEHPCVLGNAALTLSAAVKHAPAVQERAFAAGALPILVRIAGNDTMLLSCKAGVLLGAGDVARAAPDAAAIAPLTRLLFDCSVGPMARHPHLLDAGPHGNPGEADSPGVMLHAVVCVLATLCDLADVRPLFLRHEALLRTVAAEAAKRPHAAAHTAALLRERVLPALVQPPTRTMREEAQACAALLASSSGAQQRDAAPRSDAECAGCGARGAGFKRCSRCRHARYCTKECQAAHWSAHKQACRAPRREEVEE